MFIRGSSTAILKAVAPAIASVAHPEYRFGSYELRPDGTLLRNSEIIAIPPKELAVLRRLLADRGNVVALEDLRRAGWGEIHVSADSLPRCISSLRARLGAEVCIATVYKRGYRFEVSPLNADHAVHLRSHHTLPNDERKTNFDNPRDPVGSSRVWQPIMSNSPGLAKLIVFPFTTGAGVPLELSSEIAEETAFHLSHPREDIVELLAVDSMAVELLACNPVFALANRGLTALETGLSLGASLALSGRIAATATHFRIRAEMFRVEDAVQLWIEDFLIPRALISAAGSRIATLTLKRIDGTSSKSAHPVDVSAKGCAFVSLHRFN